MIPSLRPHCDGSTLVSGGQVYLIFIFLSVRGLHMGYYSLFHIQMEMNYIQPKKYGNDFYL